jgi:tetratricopeptide (TPR) repeat protein
LISLNNAGQCYAGLGAVQARAIFERALGQIAKANARALEIDLARNLGWVLAESGQDAQGVATLERAISLAEQFQHQHLQLQALGTLADLHLQRGRIDAAQAAAQPRRRAVDSGLVRAARGDHQRALELLSAGLIDAETLFNPVLGLRLHAAFGRLTQHPAIADVHRRMAREQIERITDSLTDRALQQSFQQSALVRSVQ